MPNALERLLRRDRLVVASALILVVAACWAWLLLGAGMGMSALEMTRHSMMDMPWTNPTDWSPGYAALMFSMWWIMMIAMMLPSATPVILLAAQVNRARPEQTPYGSSGSFTAGYLAAWGLFSIIAVALQWGLERAGFLNAAMTGTSRTLAGALLLAAGLWQFSPWKHACLRHCRSPVEFLSSAYRPGNEGAFVMGLKHGLYCLGCCWFLMLLLFVGGVMNLFWIAGLAVYVAVEKLAPGARWLSQGLGAFLVAWGGWLLMTTA